MALHSLYCADVPLRNCSLTHSLTHSEILQFFALLTPPLFRPNFGGSSVAPDRPYGGQ